MGLHGSATTTHAVRAAIERSKASIQELSERHGVNPKTVMKWKQRDYVHDTPMGPKDVRSTVLSKEVDCDAALNAKKPIAHRIWGRISFRTGYKIYAGQPYLRSERKFVIADLGAHVLDLARFFFGRGGAADRETQ